MSISGFFLPSNISNGHLQQFDSALLSGYCIKAEKAYIDIASKNGISESSIMIPVPQIANDYMNSYVAYNFAIDSIGINNTEVTSSDMYVVMHKINYDQCRIYLKDLTPAVIQGVASNNPSSYSVSTGRSFRTS